MNKRLDEAVARVKALPEERQGEVAELLFDFLEPGNVAIHLTPAQVAEIEAVWRTANLMQAMRRCELCSSA